MIYVGARKLIEHLKKHKIPFALATSSKTDSYFAKITRHGDLFDLFDVIVRGDDEELKRSKPAPDIFQLAAKRLGGVNDSQHCLVFEDAPSGVQAAVNANMKVIMVPDERMHVDNTKDATLVLKSLEAFVPEEWGLPPYEE